MIKWLTQFFRREQGIYVSHDCPHVREIVARCFETGNDVRGTVEDGELQIEEVVDGN